MIRVHILRGSASSTNAAPTISISPVSVVATPSSYPHVIAMTGTASDAEDGTITADITWSNADTGGSASYSFNAAGSYLISATVEDSGGKVATAICPVLLKTSPGGGGDSGNTGTLQNSGALAGAGIGTIQPGGIA